MDSQIIITECKPKLLLFRNVRNSPAIRSKIIKAEVPAAFINPRYVLDRFQVLVACQLAHNNLTLNSLKTHSVFSEIIYNFSPTKKITESLGKFGISDSDTTLFCVVIDHNQLGAVCDIIKGNMEDVTQSPLPDMFDVEEIKKVYKIREEELIVGTLLEAVVNRMSTKHIVAF